MTMLPGFDVAEAPILALFAREVPEVASGVVEIRALARIPGVRTKIAVMSKDPAVHPVKACVGAGEERIHRILAALHGERVDIVRWSDSAEQIIRRAVAPTSVLRIELEAENRRARVVVPAHEYGHALGKDDTMRDLASRLTGWHIELVSGPARERT